MFSWFLSHLEIVELDRFWRLINVFSNSDWISFTIRGAVKELSIQSLINLWRFWFIIFDFPRCRVFDFNLCRIDSLNLLSVLATSCSAIPAHQIYSRNSFLKKLSKDFIDLKWCRKFHMLVRRSWVSIKACKNTQAANNWVSI